MSSHRLPAAVVAIAVLLTGCAGSTEGVFGAELYEQSCARCHGSAGEGGIGGPIGPGSDSVGYSDGQMSNIIEVGPGTMPGFPGFTDEQVDSLVAYMRILQASE